MVMVMVIELFIISCSCESNQDRQYMLQQIIIMGTKIINQLCIIT